MQTIVGIAVPFWALDSVLLLFPGDRSWLPHALFRPAGLDESWSLIARGCFGQLLGPPHAKHLGLWLVTAEATWSLALAAAPCLLAQTYFSATAASPASRRLARTYSVTTCLALLSYLVLVEGTIRVVMTQ